MRADTRRHDPIMAAAKAAVKWKSRLEGLAWLAPELRSPELFGDEVDDALLGLKGPRHAEEGGGVSEDARRR